MAINPAGLVMVGDGGAPRVFTAACREAISGGQAVFCSGTADAVSSGLNSYATGDIKVVTGASGIDFNGIALSNTESGTTNYVSVATNGVFILRAAGTIAAGRNIAPNGADGYVTSAVAGMMIGRALTNATSGGFFIADIKA